MVVLLALAMVLTLAPALSLGAPATDTEGHWAEDVIGKWTDSKIVEGYPDGQFKPDNAITRAEFAALVNRTYGFVDEAQTEFSDVASTDWYAVHVSKAAAAGYMQGYPEGDFRPDAEISRQEAALVLSRLNELEETDDTYAFTDIQSIPDWSKGAVVAAAKAGLVTGYPDGSFGPTSELKRAEIVTILDRSIAWIVTEASVYGDHATQTVINGNVIVLVPGVELHNYHIKGNLLIAQSVGDGDVTLNMVDVDGKLSVSGGGSESVVIRNSRVSTLVVGKKGVRVRLEEGSKVARAIIKAVSRLDIAKNASVTDLVVDAPAAVEGEGQIENATVNANGATIEQQPASTTVAQGITATVGGQEVAGPPAPPTSPTYTYDDDDDWVAVTGVSIEGIPVVGTTLKAKDLKPSNANVDYQWQYAIEQDGVYEDITGANEATYTLMDAQDNRFIRLKVVGKGSYSGTRYSEPAGPIAEPVIGTLVAATDYTSYNNWKSAFTNEGNIDFGYIVKSYAIKMGIADPDYYGVALYLIVEGNRVDLKSPEVIKAIRITPSGGLVEALVTDGGEGVQFVHTGWGEIGQYTMYYFLEDNGVIEASIVIDSLTFWEEALLGYQIKAGVKTIADVNAMEFLESVAKWESIDEKGKLGYEDGKVIFVDTLEKDDHGRTSGLYLTTTAPTKDRTSATTGEEYVAITNDSTTYYVVFDAEPAAGSDGRTSKYLCAIESAKADSYEGAEKLADIGEYKFDFFFGQDKALAGYVVKAGSADLDVDATVFLRAVAEWESEDGKGKLGYEDGKIIFVDTLETDQFSRNTSLSLTHDEPSKTRSDVETGNRYVTISKGSITYYVIFGTQNNLGRTSKYLCAIHQSSEGYSDEDAEELADITEYKFDFFYGQDKEETGDL